MTTGSITPIDDIRIIKPWVRDDLTELVARMKHVRVLHVRIARTGLWDRWANTSLDEDIERLERGALYSAPEVRPTLTEVAFQIRQVWRLNHERAWVKCGAPLSGRGGRMVGY